MAYRYDGQASIHAPGACPGCHVLSDPSCKEMTRPLEAKDSADLVRRIIPQSYTVDGRLAAGILADTVPKEYTSPGPGTGGQLTVDYNSLFSHLWAAFRPGAKDTPAPPPLALPSRTFRTAWTPWRERATHHRGTRWIDRKGLVQRLNGLPGTEIHDVPPAT